MRCIRARFVSSTEWPKPPPAAATSYPPSRNAEAACLRACRDGKHACWSPSARKGRGAALEEALGVNHDITAWLGVHGRCPRSPSLAREVLTPRPFAYFHEPIHM